MTNERPIAVTLICWYFILGSLFVAIMLISTLAQGRQIPTFQVMFGFVDAVLVAFCGVALMKRLSWARILWIVLWVVAMYNKEDIKIYHFLLPAVIVFFLFNGSARRYFSPENATTVLGKPGDDSLAKSPLANPPVETKYELPDKAVELTPEEMSEINKKLFEGIPANHKLMMHPDSRIVKTVPSSQVEELVQKRWQIV